MWTSQNTPLLECQTHRFIQNSAESQNTGWHTSVLVLYDCSECQTSTGIFKEGLGIRGDSEFAFKIKFKWSLCSLSHANQYIFQDWLAARPAPFLSCVTFPPSSCGTVNPQRRQSTVTIIRTSSLCIAFCTYTALFLYSTSIYVSLIGPGLHSNCRQRHF